MRASLLTVHILGAILGLGPGLALGPMAAVAERSSEEVAGALYGAMRGIQRALVIPFTALVIPGAGVGLIITGHWMPLRTHRWLAAGILLYAVALAIGFVHGANLSKRIRLLGEGRRGSPEWKRIRAMDAALGGLDGLLLVAIVALMVWKPSL